MVSIWLRQMTPWSGAIILMSRFIVAHRLQQLADQGRVEVEDVGIVFGRLVHHVAERGLVVEPFAGGIMLAEGVAGDEDAVFLEVGEHRIGPVQHLRFEELDGAPAEGELVAALDDRKRPVLAVKMVDDGLVAGRRADQLFRLDDFHHRRQGARMIHLDVVDHQVVDLLGVDDGADPAQQFIEVRMLDRIEQGDLFIDDQVGVVGGAPVGGISVKIPDVPIDRSDPVDSFGQFGCAHASPPVIRWIFQ